jgi:serine/threonine protein kinase
MTARDSWHFEPGDPLTPELSVISELGGGAAYEAYLAFDEVTYGAVVVKVVRPAQVTDDVTLRGLRREAATLAALRHPALVRDLRVELEGERPHLVLEHLDGPRLSTLVRKHGPLSPQQYLPLGIEVASALHYMHHQGFVHLDVKPSNIIMGAPARLIDLSVMRTAQEAARLDHVIGTDAYLAPEQADPGRLGKPGPESDVWGLGATLFHAIAGHRPFPDGDPRAMEVALRHPQVVADTPRLPARTPDEVAKVVLASLERAPTNRPEPAEVADLLQPVLERLPRARLTGLLRR